MTGGIDRSTYLGAFREEMEEHLQVLTQGLLVLESHPSDASSLSEVFRRAHTMKGSARMMGFGDVADLAHSVEDVLEDLRSGRLRVGSPLLDALLTAVDLLRELVKSSPGNSTGRPDVQAVLRWLGDLRGSTVGTPAPEVLQQDMPLPARPQPETPPRETVRIGVDRIETILNLAGELMVLDAARRQASDDFAQLVETLDAALVAVRGGDRAAVGTQLETLSLAVSKTGKLGRRLASQETEVIRELHYEVSSLRMLPIRALFSLVPRAARDLARDQQKEVEVIVEGENTEIDREVLERVRDPVIHLVRNAVGHGIEPPALRIAAGKSGIGKIRVAAYTQGEQAVIEVEDDGGGIDLRAVRDAAVMKGILTSVEADALDDAECMRLLFLPGFSTRLVVSDLSGRGVGLDAVKAEVDALKGRVWIASRPGQGTKVTLELPITLAFTHVVLFEVGHLIFGLTCAAIQGIADVPADAVRRLQGRETAKIAGRTVPLVRMHRVLTLEPGIPTEASRWPALLLGPRERPVAFVVDRIVGDENVVVKPLGPLLRRVPNQSGGFILGSGRVALLLSASALVEAARGVAEPAGARGATRPQRKGKRVLVVDDAAITRELERGILEAAGYHVETAVDGRDALAKLRSHKYALIVSDVEMPGLDGFQLATAIRADRELAQLPIVIVSSRESDEDRRKGMEIGVQAYVGKGAFDQVTLLDTIEALIG